MVSKLSDALVDAEKAGTLHYLVFRTPKVWELSALGNLRRWLPRSLLFLLMSVMA